MTSENVAAQEAAESGAAVSAKAVDDQLIDELVSRAHAECLQLTGHGGLLQQALGAEGRLAQDPASYGVVRGDADGLAARLLVRRQDWLRDGDLVSRRDPVVVLGQYGAHGQHQFAAGRQVTSALSSRRGGVRLSAGVPSATARYCSRAAVRRPG